MRFETVADETRDDLRGVRLGHTFEKFFWEVEWGAGSIGDGEKEGRS